MEMTGIQLNVEEEGAKNAGKLADSMLQDFENLKGLLAVRPRLRKSTLSLSLNPDDSDEDSPILSPLSPLSDKGNRKGRKSSKKGSNNSSNKSSRRGSFKKSTEALP